MSAHEVNAKGLEKDEPQQPGDIEKTIYIGVFFDGTQNNKFQVALGRYFRLKENKKAAKEGSQTAKDKLEYGRGKGEYNSFIEDSIHTADIYDLPPNVDMAFEDGLVGKGSVEGIPNDIIYNDIESDTVRIFSPNDTNSEIETAKEKQRIFDYKKYVIQKEQTKEGKQRYKDIIEDYKKAYESDDESDNSDKFKDSKGGNGQALDTYTNVAILEALYRPKPCAPDEYFPVYVEGPGTDLNFFGGPGTISGTRGMAFGTGSTGVEAKVQKAISAVRNICYRFTSNHTIRNLTVHLSTYGFSRGATGARLFSYHSRGKEELLGNLWGIEKVELKFDFAGLFDTVSSEGVYHRNDVDNLKLWGVKYAKSVLHLCAMDEHRANFALTDIENCINSVGTELFMPGCHSDIGGAGSIGMESGFTKINSEIVHEISALFGGNFYTEHCYMWLFNPCTAIAPVNVVTLDKMGWIDTRNNINLNEVNESVVTDKNIEIKGGAYKNGRGRINMTLYRNVQIRQYVKPGYSNIALHLMHTKVQELFKPIPTAYQLSDRLLCKCYGDWVKEIGSPGRKMAKLSNNDYKALRRDYLYISMNDAYVGGHAPGDIIVNGPSYEKKAGSLYDKIIMRRVFKGVPGGGERFMDELSYA